MKLELKHLAPYLPYGLKIRNGITIYTMVCDAKQYDTDGFISLESIEGVASKPILRPLSDLTKVKEVSGVLRILELEILKTPFATLNQLENHRWMIVNCYYDDLLILFENHFDVFGLIDAGLAIDINTLEK